MHHDLMYSGSVGGGTEGSLLLFGSSSSMASIAAAIAAAGDVAAAARPRLKCPRCDSLNTKFCYYNNYNLSQPRHFCKSCRRYWTKGGILRNVPVGGGSRRSASSSSSSASRRGASGSTSSSSSSSRNLRRQQQHGAGQAGSPRPSSPDDPSGCNFHMDGIQSTPTRGLRPARPELSEESSSEEADLISTTAAIPVSPPQQLPTTVDVVDGPSVDELMTAAESFPFNQLGGASCGSAVEPFHLPVQGEDMPPDVVEYGAVEFADQAVLAVPDDNTIGAVVMGARRNEEEEVRREVDVALDAIGATQPQGQGQPADVTLDAVAPQPHPEPAAANYVVDNHWQDLHNVPLVSDNYDYDIYATVGIAVAGGANNYVHNNQQLQLQLQLQQPQQLQLQQPSLDQQLEGGLLWDNSGFHYHQWGGIEIDQSVLDLL